MIPGLDPTRTTWHITFGTHGSRLHGDDRPTVERDHNQPGEPFVEPDADRMNDERERLRGPAVRLTQTQRALIEAAIPTLCERGGWTYRVAAAPLPPDDHHVHVLLDAERRVHGKDIRKWLKRWLSESLNARFEPPPAGWWAECGSTKPVKNEPYLRNTYHYIKRQRTTRDP